MNHRWKITRVRNYSLAIVLFLFAPAIVPTIASAQCGGTWRWDVKTCSDEPALLKDTPTETTVAYQSHLKPPMRMAIHSPRSDSERSVLTLTAFVVGWKFETDSDIHLQVKDLITKDSMVAEIPNPHCTGVSSNTAFAHQCELNRQWVFENLPKKNKRAFLLPKPVKVHLTGIGFFDEAGHYSKKLKTTVGHANGSNIYGREIHPVTTIGLAE